MRVLALYPPPPQRWRRYSHIRLLCVWAASANCARAVVGHMKRRGSGRIAFVSSAAGQVGIFGYTGYSASKFALLGLAQALQMELNPYVAASGRVPGVARVRRCPLTRVCVLLGRYNIAVSLAFPPDTNTPMLEQEDVTKPAETKEIAGTVSLLEPGQSSVHHASWCTVTHRWRTCTVRRPSGRDSGVWRPLRPLLHQL